MDERRRGIAVDRGISFTGLLAIAFIVLKLTHVINWNWWWVLCPLWGPTALILVILIFVFILSMIK